MLMGSVNFPKQSFDFVSFGSFTKFRFHDKTDQAPFARVFINPVSKIYCRRSQYTGLPGIFKQSLKIFSAA